MKALLDTHAFIWWANNDPQLSVSAQRIIADRANDIFISAVSTWEMAIKVAIGKLVLAQPVGSFVRSQTAHSHFQLLTISPDHTYLVESLPMHHTDPFDRLLIAQTILEGMVLITHDGRISRYAVPIAW